MSTPATTKPLANYTSFTLNTRLEEISNETDKYGYEAFGGKAIAYVGWFWREVNFDEEGGYSFGVLPVCDGDIDSNDTVRVGFMENNKWDYDYIEASASQWDDIRRLLVKVADTPCEQTLRAADEAIQGLLK